MDNLSERRGILDGDSCRLCEHWRCTAAAVVHTHLCRPISLRRYRVGEQLQQVYERIFENVKRSAGTALFFWGPNPILVFSTCTRRKGRAQEQVCYTRTEQTRRHVCPAFLFSFSGFCPLGRHEHSFALILILILNTPPRHGKFSSVASRSGEGSRCNGSRCAVTSPNEHRCLQ